jgi:hypothetical protein
MIPRDSRAALSTLKKDTLWSQAWVATELHGFAAWLNQPSQHMTNDRPVLMRDTLGQSCCSTEFYRGLTL